METAVRASERHPSSLARRTKWAYVGSRGREATRRPWGVMIGCGLDGVLLLFLLFLLVSVAGVLLVFHPPSATQPKANNVSNALAIAAGEGGER